ncbi:MAG: hypothetical protein JNL26_06825 [Gemmatimonadetes bacterium]|nr:hypothetical protein [Gemmatimonadota bacterium]
MKRRATRGETRGVMGVRAFEAARPLRGRTTTDTTPVHIKDLGGDDSLDPARVRSALGRKLGKYALTIDRITVTCRDESGPVGARVVCAGVTITTNRLGPIVVTARAPTSWLAVSAAIRSGERSMRRRLERQREARR